MKRMVLFSLLLALLLIFTGCGDRGPFTEVDYPAAIMVDGTIYYKTADPVAGDVDESAVLGYTTSYCDAMPHVNGETNFNRELHMPYARVSDGIAVLYENEWYLCIPEF